MNALRERLRMSDRISSKWLGSPVATHGGTLAEIESWIPTFERRVFGAEQRGEDLVRLNEHLDTIVRLPFREDDTCVPVGVVSKSYSLVQHTAVLRAAIDGLLSVGIDPGNLVAEIEITEYGERMALCIYLPEEYCIDPGDGHVILPRLELWNSVDRSVRLRVLISWFRIVCSNGLIIEVKHGDVRRRHVNALQVADIAPTLEAGLRNAAANREKLLEWRDTAITPSLLEEWVDGLLQKTWGFKAAARAYHIACKGLDCEVVGPYKDAEPTTVNVRATDPVPGAPIQTRNLFDVSQILAWLAKERRDLQEQLEWREQIAGLMAALTH